MGLTHPWLRYPASRHSPKPRADSPATGQQRAGPDRDLLHLLLQAFCRCDIPCQDLMALVSKLARLAGEFRCCYLGHQMRNLNEEVRIVDKRKFCWVNSPPCGCCSRGGLGTVLGMARPDSITAGENFTRSGCEVYHTLE